MNATLTPSVRINSGATSVSQVAATSTSGSSSSSVAHPEVTRWARAVRERASEDAEDKEKDVPVANPMSVSVPNLSADHGANIEPTAAAGLLETFAAIARRRTFGRFIF